MTTVGQKAEADREARRRERRQVIDRLDVEVNNLRELQRDLQGLVNDLRDEEETGARSPTAGD